MKTVFALGVLAALCQAALALKGGLYTIRSVSSGNSSLLTPIAEGKPLVFRPEQKRNSTQAWAFIPVGANGRTFRIQDLKGDFLNCNETEGVPCYAGLEPQVFTAESAGADKYELVDEQGTGSFLQASPNSTLVLADWDPSPRPNQQFHVVPYV